MYQGEVWLLELPEEKILESNKKTIINVTSLPKVKKVINLTDATGIATLQDNGVQELDFPMNKEIPYDIDREHAKTVICNDIFDFYAPITNADVMAIEYLMLRNPYTESVHQGMGPISLIHSDATNYIPYHTDQFYTEKKLYFWTRPGIKLDVSKLKYAHQYEIWKLWKNLDTRTDAVWKLVLHDMQTPAMEKYIQEIGIPSDVINYDPRECSPEYALRVYTLYDHPEFDNYKYNFFPNTDKDKAIVWKVHDSLTPMNHVFHAGSYIYGEQNPVRHSLDLTIQCWKL